METQVQHAERMTIGQFADKHGLTMIVRERARFICPDDRGRWIASFDKVESKDGCVLTGEYGNGATPDEAISDYARKITGKLLVYDACGENRKEFYASCDFVVPDQAMQNREVLEKATLAFQSAYLGVARRYAGALSDEETRWAAGAAAIGVGVGLCMLARGKDDPELFERVKDTVRQMV